jgi:ankyrin repeat protein
VSIIVDEQIYTLILDPISKQIFLDPIITECGHSFEKDSIEQWCEQKKTCPICQKPIFKSQIRENLLIKNIVKEIIQKDPSLKKKQYFPVKAFLNALNDDEELAIDIINSHPHLLNRVIHQGRAPLHIAIESNQIDLVRSLLEFDELDINIPTELPHSNPGSTAYHLAASFSSQHFLELLVSQGASGQLDEHLLTPLQIATLAASSNSSKLLLRTIKNMVEVYLANKDVKKTKKRPPKSTKVLLNKLSHAIQNKDHDQLSDLLKARPNIKSRAVNIQPEVGYKNGSDSSLMSEVVKLLQINDIQGAALILSKYYQSNGSSKSFMSDLELLKDTFCEQYEQLCALLLLEIIPDAKEGDTELLLKLFGSNMMSTPNFFDMLDRRSSFDELKP